MTTAADVARPSRFTGYQLEEGRVSPACAVALVHGLPDCHAQLLIHNVPTIRTVGPLRQLSSRRQPCCRTNLPTPVFAHDPPVVGRPGELSLEAASRLMISTEIFGAAPQMVPEVNRLALGTDALTRERGRFAPHGTSN